MKIKKFTIIFILLIFLISASANVYALCWNTQSCVNEYGLPNCDTVDTSSGCTLSSIKCVNKKLYSYFESNGKTCIRCERFICHEHYIATNSVCSNWNEYATVQCCNSGDCGGRACVDYKCSEPPPEQVCTPYTCTRDCYRCNSAGTDDYFSSSCCPQEGFCGDGKCDSDETCRNCRTDCGPCPGVCTWGQWSGCSKKCYGCNAAGTDWCGDLNYNNGGHEYCCKNVNCQMGGCAAYIGTGGKCGTEEDSIPIGGCDYSPACSPTSESQPCGDGGTQTRTRSTACDGGCTSWSGWSSCGGEVDCTSGEWSSSLCASCTGGQWGPSCSDWGPGGTSTWQDCQSRCGGNPDEGKSCGTCMTGKIDRNGNCIGAHCTYSPACSPTSQLRCLNGKLERRTRGTNCCGGCSGWSGWSVSDDCPSHDAWCRGNACVDCDLDLDICNKCSGQEFYSSLYSSSNNLRCCKNFNNANEWPMDITIQWGGIACCDQSNDCPISNTDCVNNLDSDYNIERMEADTICVDGNLMSRTKLISLQLLGIAKNKGSSRYVLFCDEKNNSLNYVQEENAEINNTNNICVLSLKDSNGNDQQIMIGASLNQKSNLLSLISSISVCANVENKNEFQACNAEKTIYYNPMVHAVIFSTKEITNVKKPIWTVSLVEFLTDLINRILGTNYGQSADISYISQREERYTNLYVNRMGDKAIRAVKEPRIKSGNEVEVIIADYEGFSGNICTGQTDDKYEGISMGNHNKRFGVTDANYNCSATSEGYQMFLQNNTFSDKWSDITAKLRPK